MSRTSLHSLARDLEQERDQWADRFHALERAVREMLDASAELGRCTAAGKPAPMEVLNRVGAAYERLRLLVT